MKYSRHNSDHAILAGKRAAEAVFAATNGAAAAITVAETRV